MPYQARIDFLPEGKVLAECGPMRLVISASGEQGPMPRESLKAAEESFTALEKVAGERALLGKGFLKERWKIRENLNIAMLESVLAVNDGELTPMAAVAGAIADYVADFLVNLGVPRVAVDNGGDLAVRIGCGGAFSVGVRTDVRLREITHVINLDQSTPSWGVATSGLGGRSLTRGVASSATVIASRSALADAAATSIANATHVDDEEIVQLPAEEVDPYTDIPGVPVTVRMGELPGEKVDLALNRARKRAEQLVEARVIFGALVAVQGEVTMTDFFREHMITCN
ncbi:MAG: hypothetical protein ACLFUP_04925 [Desulfobacteraceae bacterium]